MLPVGTCGQSGRLLLSTLVISYVGCLVEEVVVWCYGRSVSADVDNKFMLAAGLLLLVPELANNIGHLVDDVVSCHAGLRLCLSLVDE